MRHLAMTIYAALPPDAQRRTSVENVQDVLATLADEENARSKHTIEGTVVFRREADPKKQVCICCPKGGGHIYGRGVKWDQWDTAFPEHFGNGPGVLVDSKITNVNANEGRRVRVTVELID